MPIRIVYIFSLSLIKTKRRYSFTGCPCVTVVSAGRQRCRANAKKIRSTCWPIAAYLADSATPPPARTESRRGESLCRHKPTRSHDSTCHHATPPSHTSTPPPGAGTSSCYSSKGRSTRPRGTRRKRKHAREMSVPPTP